MKAPSSLILSILLLFHNSASAAVHAVLPGTSIQAKVDLAQPGDIVAIFGGTYPGDVSINKAIRLVEVDGQDVTITGNVTFTGITDAPPFEGFTVGSSGKGITVTNTTGLLLKNIDARPGAGVTISGTSKAGITGGFYSQITQNGGELTATLTEVVGDFNTTVNAQKSIAYRTTVTGNVNWSSSKAWFGYSKAWHFKSTATQGDLVLVGSEIDGRNFYAYDPNHSSPNNYSLNIGIDISGTNNRIAILNCIVKGMSYGWVADGPYVYVNADAFGIIVRGSQQAHILNNYIQLNSPSGLRSGNNWQNNLSDPGIQAQGSNCRIYNNIIENAWDGIVAPFGADVRNNFYYGIGRNTESGGVVSTGSLSGNPSFVSGQAPNLQVSSPCINAGVNDPIFNDLNGTRNDIGPSGGCLFDPNGWTTANPVVVSFDLAPQQLLKGVDTQVTLSNGQGVSQP